MFKKIFVGLAFAGVCASAFAGMPKDQVAMPTGVNLLAPDSDGTWMLGLEALYVRPAGSDYLYTQTFTPSTPVQTFQNQYVKQSPHFGGTIDFGYMFPGNSRDLKFVYTHIEMADSSSVTDTLVFDSTKGHSRYNYNAGDAIVGQWIRIGERVDLHPFAGLRYASIDMHDKLTNGTSTLVPFVSGLSAKFKSDFHGIGPRLGLDAAAHFGSGVSVVSTVGASLLIGDLDSGYSTAVPSFAANNKNDDVTQTVPELDARLGIHYDYSFNPGTVLGLELGYQVENYYDAAQKGFVDTIVPNTAHDQQNFAYYGPYLRAQVAIN